MILRKKIELELVTYIYVILLYNFRYIYTRRMNVMKRQSEQSLDSSRESHTQTETTHNAQ